MHKVWYTGSHMDKTITPRTADYSLWYQSVIDAADLAEHSPVRGCMVIKPNGYALWERVQSVLDAEFKKTGVQNAYFPMFIPEKLMNREKDHVAGFAPEVAVVTMAGNQKLDEPLIIRPTSETIIYEVVRDWIQSYRDLPILVNQWCNVVRWEKKTKPFLRTTEFLWQEGHTIHRTFVDADDRARQMALVYANFARDYMAIPGVSGQKTESEKFAGAHTTYTYETMMQDGRALQFATSHNLGDNFAKSFDLTFVDNDETRKHVWQTSWGLSTRSIGALIMVHSDDKGLVLPPRMCVHPVVVIPIFKSDSEQETVVSYAKNFAAQNGYQCDERDYLRPGEKFFHWEKRGIPIRIEIGPRDIASGSVVVVRRDTSEKIIVSTDIPETIARLLETIQADMLARAQTHLDTHVVDVTTKQQLIDAVEAGNFARAFFCNDASVEAEIKELYSITTRCIPFDQAAVTSGVCAYTGKPASVQVLFGKNY